MSEDAVTKYRNLTAQRQELNKTLKQLRKEFREIAPKAFAQESKELFAKFPKLQSFGWTQFTPYFNDGDTCYFQVHCHEPYINELPPYDFEDDELVAAGLNQKEWEELSTAVAKFLAGYDKETLEDAFGDHVQITVEKDGDNTKVTTEDYQHD